MITLRSRLVTLFYVSVYDFVVGFLRQPFERILTREARQKVGKVNKVLRDKLGIVIV